MHVCVDVSGGVPLRVHVGVCIHVYTRECVHACVRVKSAGRMEEEVAPS